MALKLDFIKKGELKIDYLTEIKYKFKNFSNLVSEKYYQNIILIVD